MTAIIGKSISAPTLHGNKNMCSGGIFDMAYPVARIRSITPRILRRYALWAGSDRPTPRGSSVDVPAIDAVSSVVVKELTEDTEDAPPLREFGDIELLWFRQGRLYICVDKGEAPKGSVTGLTGHDVFDVDCMIKFSVLYSTKRTLTST